MSLLMSTLVQNVQCLAMLVLSMVISPAGMSVLSRTCIGVSITQNIDHFLIVILFWMPKNRNLKLTHFNSFCFYCMALFISTLVQHVQCLNWLLLSMVMSPTGMLVLSRTCHTVSVAQNIDHFLIVILV